MGFLGKIADTVTKRVDNYLFNTDKANEARGKMADPNFVNFMEEAEKQSAVSMDELRNPDKQSQKKLGKLYMAFEKKELVTRKTKEILLAKISAELGVNEADISPSALKSIDEFFERTTFENPKKIEQFSATFVKAEKLQKEMAASRRSLDSLVTRFGADKLELMDEVQSAWTGFGTKKTREWAREEARNRGYGPLRSWVFSTFSAHSAAKEEIMKGKGMSWERVEEVYGHINEGKKGLSKIERKYDRQVIGGMLGTTELVQKTLEDAQKSVVDKALLTVLNNPAARVEEVQKQRALLKKMEGSDIAGEQFKLENAAGVYEKVDLATFQAAFEKKVEERLALAFKGVIKDLETKDIPFCDLRKRITRRVEQLSADGLETPAQARAHVAEILAKTDASKLDKGKQMMIAMIINDLTR
jgi:hypothetical protein